MRLKYRKYLRTFSLKRKIWRSYIKKKSLVPKILSDLFLATLTFENFVTEYIFTRIYCMVNARNLFVYKMIVFRFNCCHQNGLIARYILLHFNRDDKIRLLKYLSPSNYKNYKTDHTSYQLIYISWNSSYRHSVNDLLAWLTRTRMSNY